MVETVGKSLRHSCRSELRRIPLFRGGTDYAFISTRLRTIDSGSYPRLPLGLIRAASRTIHCRPVHPSCSPPAIRWQMSANSSRSFYLPDSNGYISKCGMIFTSKTERLQTSHFNVSSVRSNGAVTEVRLQRQKYFGPVAVLAHRQTRSDLPANGKRSSGTDRDREASLTVDIP